MCPLSATAGSCCHAEIFCSSCVTASSSWAGIRRGAPPHTDRRTTPPSEETAYPANRQAKQQSGSRRIEHGACGHLQHREDEHGGPSRPGEEPLALDAPPVEAARTLMLGNVPHVGSTDPDRAGTDSRGQRWAEGEVVMCNHPGLNRQSVDG